MHDTTVILRSVGCGCDHERAAADPDQRISSHRTSVGHVIYFRCYCRIPRVKLWRWSRSHRRVS
jgi:hypothetical protein